MRVIVSPHSLWPLTIWPRPTALTGLGKYIRVWHFVIFFLVFVCCFVVNWKDYWQFSHCFAKFLLEPSKYLPLVLPLICNSMLLTVPCLGIQISNQFWTWQMFGQTVGLQQGCDGPSCPDSLQSKQAHCHTVHATKLENKPWRKMIYFYISFNYHLHNWQEI